MASENAKKVALEVSENIRDGKKVILGKIIAKRYSKSTSRSPQRVTETKSYQKVMKPLIDRLVIERDRAIKMLSKRISGAKYRDLTDGIDKLTKNIQLLSGGKTSNDVVKLEWEKP